MEEKKEKEKDYSGNPEFLKTLSRVVESGSSLQHFAVREMGKIIREEVDACDRGEYEIEKKDAEPEIRTVSFFLQTEKGKFLYASFSDTCNKIVLPLETIPIVEFYRIVRDAIHGYRPAEPQDYNYLYIHGRGDVKPTPELLEKRRTLISKEPILSDVIYQRNEKPNWGRVEIDVFEASSGNEGMDVITPNGEYIHYSFLHGSLTVTTNSSDLSWDGTPDKEKELYSQKGTYGAATYSVVKSEEEMKRLLPQFWQIIKQVIGDDKVIAISSSGDSEKWVSLTLEEAKRKYKSVQPVMNKQRLIFKGTNPRPSGYEGEGFPIYYFPMENNEIGVLIDRSRHGYLIPYLFYRTKWYKNGISVDNPEIIFE